MYGDHPDIHGPTTTVPTRLSSELPPFQEKSTLSVGPNDQILSVNCQRCPAVTRLRGPGTPFSARRGLAHRGARVEALEPGRQLTAALAPRQRAVAQVEV